MKKQLLSDIDKATVRVDYKKVLNSIVETINDGGSDTHKIFKIKMFLFTNEIVDFEDDKMTPDKNTPIKLR